MGKNRADVGLVSWEEVMEKMLQNPKFKAELEATPKLSDEEFLRIQAEELSALEDLEEED